MIAAKLAPIAKRVYLSGTFRDYRVLLKDNAAGTIIWEIRVPTAGMGHAIVRALRAYATEREGRLF